MSKDRKEEEDELGDYSHDFTDDELAQMFYLDDEENSEPVQEYYYLKPEWTDSNANSLEKPKKEKTDMQYSLIDTGERSIVDLDKDAPEDEELVFLDLDTAKTAHVVEFYSPYCPHCKHFKYEYVDIAREVTRRTIETQVEFHAVSCALYRPLCRAYGINGFPIVYGWPVGSLPWEEEGIELNPTNQQPMTADSIAEALEITLAHEDKDIQSFNFTDSADEREFNKSLILKGKEAANMKLKWHQYRSNTNERYHNAAASLAYVLKNAVFIDQQNTLSNRRALALKDFLDLFDWATPRSWHVRTGLVADVRDNMAGIVNGTIKLVTLVEKHQATDANGGLWGGLVAPQQRHVVLGLGGDVPLGKVASTNAVHLIRENSKWTEACTHGERGMGLTCGLWDLFHILTIGSTLPSQQVYGFRSGSLTSPRDVAQIITRFIIQFFPCDVCRFNFKDMYQNCGHDHCHRLLGIMPSLAPRNDGSDPLASDKLQKELPMWLWEVHNSVNARLMKESAAREGREVSDQEILSSKFPTRKMCPACWRDNKMANWDRELILKFLTTWYWPDEGIPSTRFALGRRLQVDESSLPRVVSDSRFGDNCALLLVLLFIGFLVTKNLRSQTVKNERKDM